VHLSLRHTPIHFACVARPIAQFGRDAERLHTWLVDMGCHKSSMTTHQTAHKIADRVLIKGFKCEIKLSDHVLTSSQSRFGDDQKRAFMNQKLTGNLGDFTGIGSASLANLAAVGITNSDGLFAAFLSIIDNPNPMANTDKCDQFYEQLGRWKVASGFKATIIYQLQSKLAVGIDSSNVGIEHCQQLDAIPEHSSPRTGEQSRALPPRAVHPETARELFPSLDTEQAREKQLAEKAAAEAIRLQQEALVHVVRSSGCARRMRASSSRPTRSPFASSKRRLCGVVRPTRSPFANVRGANERGVNFTSPPTSKHGTTLPALAPGQPTRYQSPSSLSCLRTCTGR
jgi:hypothetical protein